MFLDPYVEELFPEWEHKACDAVAESPADRLSLPRRPFAALALLRDGMAPADR
jgi:hypothetical protein